jgi:hypothetical protein
MLRTSCPQTVEAPPFTLQRGCWRAALTGTAGDWTVDWLTGKNPRNNCIQSLKYLLPPDSFHLLYSTSSFSTFFHPFNFFLYSASSTCLFAQQSSIARISRRPPRRNAYPLIYTRSMHLGEISIIAETLLGSTIPSHLPVSITKEFSLKNFGALKSNMIAYYD